MAVYKDYVDADRIAAMADLPSLLPEAEQDARHRARCSRTDVASTSRGTGGRSLAEMWSSSGMSLWPISETACGTASPRPRSGPPSRRRAWPS